MVRRAMLAVAALVVVLTACGGATAKEGQTSAADVYTAVLKQLVPASGADETHQVVYVTPFDDQKSFDLETQVAVIADLADQTTVRFVDELAEAVNADAPGAPAKGAEVVLLGPVTTTETAVEVRAQSYESENAQVRYRFRVTSSGSGDWRAEQVEEAPVTPTTSP